MTNKNKEMYNFPLSVNIWKNGPPYPWELEKDREEKLKWESLPEKEPKSPNNATTVDSTIERVKKLQSLSEKLEKIDSEIEQIQQYRLSELERETNAVFPRRTD